VPLNETQTYTATAVFQTGETQDVTNLARDLAYGGAFNGAVSSQSPGLIKGIIKGVTYFRVSYAYGPSSSFNVQSNYLQILIQ
jgi:hypothetical protein